MGRRERCGWGSHNDARKPGGPRRRWVACPGSRSQAHKLLHYAGAVKLRGIPVPIVAPLAQGLIRRLAAYLNQPYARYAPVVTTEIEQLAPVLLPGDVLLVDGNTRVAALVKHLTQSTWSHVAMYVGPLEQG